MNKSQQRKPYTFAAIVGQEKMKKALILNIINPGLSGVLIRGEKGTAKSTAVRALAELLPEIDVVDGCPFQCDPHDTQNLCNFVKASCRRRNTSFPYKKGSGNRITNQCNRRPGCWHYGSGTRS